MSRIKAVPSSTKIEHWAPESAHRDQALAYGNLLASCKGGEGNPPSLQHCDTRKADAPLTLDPTRPDSLRTLRYLPSGRIEARDDLKGDLNVVLGLNIDKLMRSRANAVQAVAEFMQQKRTSKWSADSIARHQQRLERETIAKPYVGAILYRLEKKRRTAQGLTS